MEHKSAVLNQLYQGLPHQPSMMLLQNVPLGLTGRFAQGSHTKIDNLGGFWCMDLNYQMEFPPAPTKQNFDDLEAHLKILLKELGSSLATACQKEQSASANSVADPDLSEQDLNEFYTQPFLIEIAFELVNR